MSSRPTSRLSLAVLLGAAVLILSPPARAQRQLGELRLDVRDVRGTALPSTADLVSEANHLRRQLTTNQEGRATAQNLPFGVYRLEVTHEGFTPVRQRIEIRSEVPLRVTVTLGVAPVETRVVVSDSATLLDPSRTNTAYSVGSQAIREGLSPQPGRGLSDLIQAQPGWLYEANGVLHPRGSEYDVQFVVDGIPHTENRSLAFAAPFEPEDTDSARVRTAGYPAEYGRKLGGIVELTTPADSPSGFHGEFAAQGGSFSAASGYLGLSYARGANRFALSGNGFHTDRYLDPPVLGNFTNNGTSAGMRAAFERDLTDRDRLRLTVTHDVVRFLVPNELLQQEAGQRQDRGSDETSGAIYYQRTISPNLLLNLQGRVRDVSASLSSNPVSTPVFVSQDRGFREGYIRADLAGHRGRHDWKVGADGVFSSVREAFAYQITDPSQFDPDIEAQFAFAARRWDLEQSAYVQDHMRIGNWNFSAGLRFDRYRLAVDETAWSPRLSASRFFPSLNLLVHAAYDRVFQTPAVENLLLASSPQLGQVSEEVLRLPVRPARANYYEIGVTKVFGANLRLEANFFRRDFHDFADDDVLLNTGVSFPSLSPARASPAKSSRSKCRTGAGSPGS